MSNKRQHAQPHKASTAKQLYKQRKDPNSRTPCTELHCTAKEEHRKEFGTKAFQRPALPFLSIGDMAAPSTLRI